MADRGHDAGGIGGGAFGHKDGGEDADNSDGDQHLDQCEPMAVRVLEAACVHSTNRHRRGRIRFVILIK